MSKERKAELQRKLAMTAVPRPPADLLDRIKGDIPAELSREPERDSSLWRSTIVMRVAASLMMLVTTGLITWRVLQTDVRPAAPVRVQRERPVPAVTKTLTRPASEPVAPAPVAETVAQTASAIRDTSAVVQETLPAPPPPPMKVAVPRTEEFAAQEARPQMAEADAANDEILTESITITSAAAAPADLAVASPAPPPPPPPAVAAQRAPAGATRGEVAREKSAVPASDTELARVQRSLAAGVRPADADVEALIHHFAVAAPPAGQPYVLATELSASPIDRDRLLLRVSLDVATPAAVTDARLKVDFPSDSVREARRIGGGETLGGSPGTVIYEIQPRTWLPPDSTLAEVGLEWPTRTTTQKVVAGQTRTWKDATRRHRLATLAGLWAESLSREVTNVMLATRARELHEEKQSDRLARELSAAVEASTRVRR